MAPSYPGGATGTKPENLRKTVTVLAEEIGPRDLYNNNKARLRRSEDYLTARFKAAGCRVEFQEYSASARISQSLRPGLMDFLTCAMATS